MARSPVFSEPMVWVSGVGSKTPSSGGADAISLWQDALTAPTPEVYGDYPTLVLNGQFDSLTPPTWVETAVAAIPQAQYVPIPNAWHSIMGNNGPCPTDITLQFLVNPDAAVDPGCTDAMKVIFVVAK